jgi:signal transduction histidine kinase
VTVQAPELLANPGAAVGAALVAALAIAGAAMAVVWWRQRNRARRLDAQLRQQRQRTDEAAHAGDAFFGLVSHEFRSPIAAIIGYQELLRDKAYGDIGDAALEPLDRIGRSATLLLHLIDGSLDLARIQAGDLSPDLQETDLETVLAGVAREFRDHCLERSLRHAVHMEDALPTIWSDPERIARALHLLVVSAVKNPSGEQLELRVSRERDGATVRIRGTRIPIRTESLDPALRTGIRLAIASALAELLGGSLHLEPADDTHTGESIFRIRDARTLDVDGEDRRHDRP